VSEWCIVCCVSVSVQVLYAHVLLCVISLTFSALLSLPLLRAIHPRCPFHVCSVCSSWQRPEVCLHAYAVHAQRHTAHARASCIQ
jgi:hypothetical protein